MAWLEVRNLTLKTDEATLLEDISFSLERGTITLLAGRNGSGKSMLLKSIKGFTHAEGTILLGGKALDKRRDRISSIGLVFQETELQIVGSTDEKDISFGPENLGFSAAECKAITDEAISLLGLEHVRGKSPSELSGGERRKLSIAGVIAMSPSVILLDEPLANLDYPATVKVIETLIRLKEKGFALLIASHEAEKFLCHTDKTLIMKKGRLISDAPSEDSVATLRENDIYIPKNAEFEDLTWLK